MYRHVLRLPPLSALLLLLLPQAVGVLAGRWKLAYTCNREALLLLSTIDNIPLVRIGDVYQIIDADTLTAHNKVGRGRGGGRGRAACLLGSCTAKQPANQTSCKLIPFTN